MVITVSPSAQELTDLLPGPRRQRRLLGISGAPGASKSTLAAFLCELLGERGAHVPMDGFHLADVQLVRLGLEDRKGVPGSFDAGGYAALLARLRGDDDEVVYAPGFDRTLEQPLAGALAVPRSARVVVTEGNYLLLDDPAWERVRAQLDEVWHVHVDEELRRERLLARHVEFGKTPEDARRWLETVDVPDAALVEAASDRADRVLDLTGWVPGGQ